MSAFKHCLQKLLEKIVGMINKVLVFPTHQFVQLFITTQNKIHFVEIYPIFGRKLLFRAYYLLRKYVSLFLFVTFGQAYYILYGGSKITPIAT